MSTRWLASTSLHIEPLINIEDNLGSGAGTWNHIVFGSPFSILKAILKAVNLIIDFEIDFKSGKFIYRF